MSGQCAANITPIILAGGKGERLWPLSRKHYPKQVLPLLTEKSLLQETVERVTDTVLFSSPLLICDDDSRFIIREQMESTLLANIIIEPEGRNTAAAAAIAALYLLQENADALMLVLPSDHHIHDKEAFLQAVRQGAHIANEGKLVTFGITPNRAETGYGYICKGQRYGQRNNCFIIDSFVEKPDRKTAEHYLTSGHYLWNSGIFLMQARLYLAELEKFSPAILTHASAALVGAEEDLGFIRLEQKTFAQCPSLSIDYAIMEHTSYAVVLPVQMGWSDLGAWDTLLEVETKDSNNNACVGDVLAVNCHGSYLRSEGRLLAALGLENIIVVSTSDAVLVAPLQQAQEIKNITQKLLKEGRSEAEKHVTAFRPWGNYTTLVEQQSFQVKRIIVKQAGRLSLQSHSRRSEHWIVVKGIAKVTCGDRTFLLHENESTYIPIRVKHRLENPGETELELIEVQSGSYLGEDDITRYDDVYGR